MKKKIFVSVILISCVLLGRTFLFVQQTETEKQENLKKQIKMQEKTMEIFEVYYEKAQQNLQTLTLEEKIAQMLIVDISASNNQQESKNNLFGGYILFTSFFQNKTQQQVKTEIENLQKTAKIPLLIGVDEEGGSVVRVSSNPNLVKQPFLSPSEIYKKEGFEGIKQDTLNKSKQLGSLGINLNFAPVVDITTSSKDYMYKRTLQEGKELTSQYAKTIIRESKKGKVSYTLKHFPGYGSNKDTHTKNSIDTRTYQEINENDLAPFRAGIEDGAEIIMVSHNVVTSIDEELPASISFKIHQLLREKLNFSGIIITDDMKMGAVIEQYKIKEAIVRAILAGNDMMILSIDNNTKDIITNEKVSYQDIVNHVKNMVNMRIIKEEIIDQAVKRILAWKYDKGLIQ